MFVKKSDIFLIPKWNIRAKKRVFFLFTKVLQEDRVPVGSKKRVYIKIGIGSLSPYGGSRSYTLNEGIK